LQKFSSLEKKMNDFKELIRKSTVMSLRPGQVLHHSHGLKHTVKQPHKYILYQSIDQSVYKSGYSKYSQVQRWKELFGNEQKIPTIQTAFERPVVKPVEETDDVEKQPLPMKPLEEMNQSEWEIWIDHAKSKAPEYMTLVKEKKDDKIDWKQYLSLDKLPSYPIPKAPLLYSNQKPIKVKGRILHALDANTLLVGVQGFVCTLEQANIPSAFPELIKIVKMGNRLVDHEKEYTFHVISAYHDR
jgi:hypothetical protein